MFQSGLSLLFFMAPALASAATCGNQELIVIRHGFAEHLLGGGVWNTQIASPRKDLTLGGVEEALAAGHSLRDDGVTMDQVLAVYSSPMPRTLETAAKILEGLTAASAAPAQTQADDNIPLAADKKADLNSAVERQIDAGTIGIQPDLIEKGAGDCENKAHDACHEDATFETTAAVSARVTRFLNQLVQVACSSYKKYVVVVTHAAVVESIFSKFPTVKKPPKIETARPYHFLLKDYVK